ncbi:MAG TPA: acyl-CoA dehydrogenase family protein [Tepidiformaceae bacterium]|jgi:alkylation response protein AidB-like acyl-CoA dehydrogenase|nr:acyl-CoA dehydrogenase family protein [Tepidiformaceae bacterium]
MTYLTEERLLIQKSAREFAMKEVLPAANELDRVKGDIPMSIRDQMGQLGYFGMRIPERYGGLELGVFEYILVTEELARAWMSVASIIARGNGLGGGFSDEQKERYLPRMARGEFLGAMALSEAEAGSDLANVQCRARRDGDDWVINGSKMWCTFADGADYIQVLCRTEDADPAARHRGTAMFFFEKERGTFPPGLQATMINKIGYHGWRTWELHFDDFRLPATARLGDEQREGFKSAVGFLESARAHTAARATGLARGALEDSIAYAGQRVQFGQPIGKFQAIRFKIAEMAAEIEAARQLTYFCCDAIDSGRRCDREAAMAKWFASEMAERVTSQALQIHGGVGYTTDLPIERYWRDARLTKIFEGTSEIQLRIISDRLMGDR